ncbi:Uma2 family endonuclease [Kitasatospora sp. NPDC058965]|uniref:Uma2 family endonuclease n=1 Tax=Kitasatospora sp. NPDC058965 TaxID=3346682 RepID=UPI0036B8F138
MSAAAVEHPVHQPTLLELADEISDKHPGYRVEILGSQITVTPPADMQHAAALTDLSVWLATAGLHSKESKVLQAIGLWLPEGPSDYAIPDLAVVEADCADHLIEYNCYDPVVFRMVLEVTSSDYGTDLSIKPRLYAGAGIPVYVIVDRTSRLVRVLTEPRDGEYRVHAVHRPGESFTLPASIGAEVTLAVDAVLGPEK